MGYPVVHDFFIVKRSKTGDELRRRYEPRDLLKAKKWVETMNEVESNHGTGNSWTIEPLAVPKTIYRYL